MGCRIGGANIGAVELVRGRGKGTSQETCDMEPFKIVGASVLGSLAQIVFPIALTGSLLGSTV